ncbi:peroxiredoxin [Fulvivirga sp. M361]|uniref:peroxiredoxin n=1 Tax=Fulvivirga sp. M361 TaxID=2594266 RepID=UPI001179AF1F|nr:peroxiredoxin [Fulvivirga sp. M361]TRX48408.1 peroxiredoxin [Fulvivirga sp. M361]
MALKPNVQAPDFSLNSTNGKKFQLSKSMAGRPVLIYFYPKDFTPACTKEACSFRDNFEFFKELDITIVGISTDTTQQHKLFKKKHNLPFELLSDVTGKVSKLYKAHVPVLNISKRVTYLLDKDHVVRAAYADLFSAEKHITNMIKSLKKG